jgi:hypothetical protein
VEATVTLADQRQPAELYQVARGLRWKVRQALGGWMHQVARQDAQEAGVEKRRNCRKSATSGCAAAHT